MARKQQPPQTAPDLPPEKAYAALNRQLEKLKQFKGCRYEQVEAEETEWQQFTEKLVIRSFGSDSPNHTNFRNALFAGEHYIQMWGERDPILPQTNFEARQQKCAAALRSCLSELELDIGEGPRGVYDQGQEYEYYRDISGVLKLAQKEIFIADPYLNKEIFEVYADVIDRTVHFRLLGTNTPGDVKAIAQKYASGRNFEFRQSSAFHDRVLFADDRVWLSGQSIKDAAKKKPTYIVEHDEKLMRPVYETIWQSATVLI